MAIFCLIILPVIYKAVLHYSSFLSQPLVRNTLSPPADKKATVIDLLTKRETHSYMNILDFILPISPMV